MGFVKSGLRNMLFWRSLFKFKLIWIESCTPAGHSRPHNAFEETRLFYNYGVRGIVNDLFTSYLTGRKQITGIGPLNRFKKATVSSGVPHGSVLGASALPCLNVTCNSFDQMKFYLFQDDTNLLLLR